MATPDALTVRLIAGGGSLSQAQFNQFLEAAIAANPTLFLRAIEGFEFAPPNPVDNQIIFIDSEMDSARNGVYGYKGDRNWKRIGSAEVA